MDMYRAYKSPLGYDVNDGKVDSYGVNHQNFSLRDELEYQYERQRRENKIIQGYNNQGITGNYPPQGTSFWGQSPDNNYGFGDSNIAPAVEAIKHNPLPAMGQPSVSHSQRNMENFTSEKDEYRKYVEKYLPDSWATSYDVLKKYQNEMKAANQIGADNYYHSVGMCDNAQAGRIISTIGLGAAKEIVDLKNKWRDPNKTVADILGDGIKDMGNNLRGVYYGIRYPDKNCKDIFHDLDFKTNKMR